MEEASVVVEGRVQPDPSPLVALTFQRDAHRKDKYLEAEPIALGIFQITMSVFNILSVGVFLSKGLSPLGTDVIILISSLLVVIAGSLAVAAQSLHLPTLRACLGMQIIACGASICNLVCTVVKMESIYFSCWRHEEFNTTLYSDTCRRSENVQSHFYGGGLLIQLALLAMSVTLAVYCCKVVNCCGPAPKMPVITVHTPAAQQ